MNRLLINFCAFCLLFPGIKLFAQNNLTIIDSFTNEIAFEILEAGENEIYENVIFQIGELNNNIDGYLRTKIGNILRENNYQVFRNFPKDSSFECTVLEVQNCTIKIEYSEPFSKNMLGEALVKRFVFMSIEGQLYNEKDSRVILPVNLDKQYEDEIKYNEIYIMEESPFNFTYGTKAGITAWQEFMEPALVVSSVLAVLLLLFTQRS